MKKRMSKKMNLVFALVIGVAVLGVGYTLIVSRAAGPFGSAEAESSTLAGVTLINDTNASGGKAIAFGAGTGGGSTGQRLNLDDPVKKEIAMQLVSSAENSSLNWKAQYKYIEDIGDGRGYTGGIIGFCSGCGDMSELVARYNQLKPNNVLSKYYATLVQLGNAGSESHSGLDPNFTRDWATAATDSLFLQAQDDKRDEIYFNPALTQGKADGIHALGQFMYYDAYVMHGAEGDSFAPGFKEIRTSAIKKAKTPAQGGDEKAYLNAFLDARKAVMLMEAAHDDTSRVDTEQRKFLNEGNFDLNLPLTWQTYGDSYTITSVRP
jgi:chitosanase